MKPAKLIPLKKIVFRPGNRDEIDPVKLKQLKESIIKHGVLQPVMVRPLKDKLEVIFGERRVRACRLIDVDGHIPAFERNCTEEEAEAIRMVENIERDDLTIWEQARKVQQLQKLKPQARVEDLAAEVGRPSTWVAQRLSIMKLTGKLGQLLEEQDWPIGHIVLLSRHTPEVQKELLEHIHLQQKQWRDWVGEDDQGKKIPTAPPLSDLKRTLFFKFEHVLSAARWKKDDAELVPAAGACNICPKRSSQQGKLFDDQESDKQDRCLDAKCWQRKSDALVQLSIEKVKTKSEKAPVYLGEHGSKLPEGMDGEVKSHHSFERCKASDPKAIQAVYVSGAQAGEIAWVKPPPSHGDYLKSSRPVNQKTGKVEPPSDKDRLRKLRDKREARAVELWQERLETIQPKHVTVFALAVAMGTRHRNTSRLHDGNAWGHFRGCPLDLPKLGSTLWAKIFPVLVERCKLYGSVAQEIVELWKEVNKQAVALEAEDVLQECYADAVKEITLPKTLERAGVADPDLKLTTTEKKK